MGKICWDFPLLGTGNQSGNNIAAITMFKGSGIMDGLAREVCQNSLDAKDKDLGDDVPVKVKFELMEIAKKDFPMFEGYNQALQNSIAYWTTSSLSTPKIMEFLNNVKSAADKDTIPMLVMSDYNTVGLNGVNATDSEKSFWDLLVNTEGISIKQDENSAGSFGIGKNAPFAYSSLNLVFYNTLAKDGGRAFEGVTRLVTSQREYKGSLRKTQPIGKYLFLEDEYTGRPILPTDDCPLAKIDVFNRTEIGTDVAVVGFKENEYENWEDKITVAIIKNFILSIMNGKLEITVKSPNALYEVNKDKIEELLYRTFKDDAQLKYTRQIFETIKNGQVKNVKIAEKDDLSIYVRYEDGYVQSLSRFRSTGMLINTTQESLPHFSVVVVVNDVGSLELSKTLRETEPPQHTEWKVKNITDNRELHNKAARYLRKINEEVQGMLDEFERAEITDRMDAGIGSYLPDTSDNSVGSEGTDGLRIDMKISNISSFDGRVFYNSQYESAESGSGKEVPKNGIKTGKKKRKKKTNMKIPVAEPKEGTDKGVSAGSGKVRIATVNIKDHRTFYLAANKYHCYINSPADYEKVYIQYFAGREDDKQDALNIKNYKQDGLSKVDVHGEKIGPISLKEGKNDLYIEFENSEVMGVIPIFTMEVTNEKQSN
ncbi:MAG: hypothetical protein MJ066_02430 [Clostridia bacterium]|nr:hypothetical protein [Clostridia bacterium]